MKENQKKQSFGDILAAFEKMEKEAKTEKKSTGQEWRYKKTEPTKKTLEKIEAEKQEKAKGEKPKVEKPKEQIDPMTLWLRRYGVVDKDAEEEKLQQKMSQLDRNYLRNMAPEASIDLHGLTKEEAKAEIIYTLNKIDVFVKGLLITHGYHKGIILKNFIRKEFVHKNVYKKIHVDASRTLLLLKFEN